MYSVPFLQAWLGSHLQRSADQVLYLGLTPNSGCGREGQKTFGGLGQDSLQGESEGVSYLGHLSEVTSLGPFP